MRKVSLQTIFVTNERWLIILAVVSLCLVVGLIGGAYIAFLTPLLAALVLIALAGGLLMLRSIQWGLFALVGVIYLLPFAALPVNIGFSTVRGKNLENPVISIKSPAFPHQEMICQGMRSILR